MVFNWQNIKKWNIFFGKNAEKTRLAAILLYNYKYLCYNKSVGYLKRNGSAVPQTDDKLVLPQAGNKNKHYMA